MGQTLWVLPEGKEDDDWDHSLVLVEEPGLNALSKALGEPELGSFFDFSILAEEFGGEAEPTTVDAMAAEKTLAVMIDAIKTGHAAFRPTQPAELVEELEDIAAKVRLAREAGLLVRLAVVP